LFEVVVPSLQFRIELIDNSIHGASVVSFCLFPNTVFEFIQTFRAAEPGYSPAPAASEKPVAEKIEAVSSLRHIDNPGFRRMQCKAVFMKSQNEIDFHSYPWQINFINKSGAEIILQLNGQANRLATIL
jgi:hypothetical protein